MCNEAFQGFRAFRGMLRNHVKRSIFQFGARQCSQRATHVGYHCTTSTKKRIDQRWSALYRGGKACRFARLFRCLLEDISCEAIASAQLQERQMLARN